MEARGASRLQGPFRRAARPLAAGLWTINRDGFDQLPADGPAILAPNHISFLDSAFLMLSVSRNISVVGKAEYMNSWKTKYLFSALGMIPIERSGGQKSTLALGVAEDVLNRGELLGIFPEGTRSRDGYLYKGRTGVARLAMKVGCPIFPVGVVGTDKIQPAETKFPRFRGECTIRIGRPIVVDPGGDRSEDGSALRDITDELMGEICSLSGQQYRHVYAAEIAQANPLMMTPCGAHFDD